ncbi:DgyrCDS10518 [Dimorphilus gyrociliatus]|uniref:DgyrCDS10518 n=1 Tax=Dimorphilus gyrociliatus TaxID=2664684 RepID=A0A7I8W2F8_9ANNE|nr:DgyrCDS10518 [Dimorphilus gyrociliatus]
MSYTGASGFEENPSKNTHKQSSDGRNLMQRPTDLLGQFIGHESTRRGEAGIGNREGGDESGCCGVKYERAVIFRLGRVLVGSRGPGIFFVIPCLDNFVKVDLRTISFDVPPQEILTKDSVTIAVDAVVYYRISNPMISVVNVEDASRSTRLLAQTTLRNILGTKTLSEILTDREIIAHNMQSVLDEGTDPWGVKVERVEIKDVRLPVQLQRAMAAEAEATRDARAKVIAAEGEQRASRALKEAADVINEASGALQLRYLQTLTQISAEKNSTIIFPLPIELMKAFSDGKK